MNHRMITLGGKEVAPGGEPYVIAEIGVNHEGSLEKAQEMIRQASAAGADAVKFQTYKAHKLAVKHSPHYWDLNEEPCTSQYQLFKKYDCFGPDEYLRLTEVCQKEGVAFVSTPFDDQALEFLAPLVPFVKVASADITNLPFLRKIAAVGKPVILSTGASTIAEIDQAVTTLRSGGCPQLALLHCVLNYPTEFESAHLGMIRGLAYTWPDLVIGYSDHTRPEPDMLTLVEAYLLGAAIIEKHFTYDKSLTGNDHYHAMDEKDLKTFREQIQKVRQRHGASIHKMPLKSEEPARRNARRSIVTNGEVKKGQVFKESNLTYKRPASGISPQHWDEVLGMIASRDLPDDHLLTWADLLPRQGS
jgi:N-acetylneuraminate synthase